MVKTTKTKSKRDEIKEEYNLQMQELNTVLANAKSVLKIVEPLEQNDEDENPALYVKWVVDDYVIHPLSSFHEVCMSTMNDKEEHLFFMKRRDYKKFVAACEAKRMQQFAKQRQK